MNFLKLFKSFFFDQFMLGFGGGGGGAPTTNTTQTSNIPEYAKPYVTNMLTATQQQLFEGTPTEGGGMDITGFKPYTPYSANPADYVAGFSPLQQQAQQGAGQLQTPGQFGAATQMAGAAGMGAMGAQRQGQMLGRQALGYGAQGAGIGGLGVQAAQQGFGAGEQFARQATDPYATQAYMSPYMQNVVDYQKGQALRDYQIAAPMRAAKAVGQGAFGGSRQAIESAEAQRNLMGQLQGIEAQGAQQAFQNAQAQQQFGANLGLQGLQAGYGGLGLGLQGAQAGLSGVQGAIGAGQYGLAGLGQATQAASTLGSLGGAQLGAQKDIIGLQNQMGTAQQQQQQQIINQAIQDYATQQQYPMMQLGFMSNMLRGLPMQASSTQMYQAAPSTAQQVAGLGLGALGAAKAFS